jgi:hypothetical protein
MLLHSFIDPPNILLNTSFISELKMNYAFSSIVFIYSSFEYFVKISGRTIYDYINPKIKPEDLNIEDKKDLIFLLKSWNNVKNCEYSSQLERVLDEFPKHARKRLKNQNQILEKDIETYRSLIDKFNTQKHLRHCIIHNTLHQFQSIEVFKKVFGFTEQNNKHYINTSIFPEKALDFYVLCIKTMEYFTYVCFPGVEGNYRSKNKECFDVKDMILHASIFEYEIPQQLVDLLDQKLANYP